MQAPELVVTIQDRRASHHGHQDHVGRNEFSLFVSVAATSICAPAPSGARFTVTGHGAIAANARLTFAINVDRLQIICRLEHHAKRQRDDGHDHLPGVWRTEASMGPEELSSHGECVSFSALPLANNTKFIY